MRTYRTHSTRRLVTAAAGLALVLTAVPAHLLRAQTTQDTAHSPWRVNPRGTTTTPWPTPPTTTTRAPTTVPVPSTQAMGPVAADSAYIREAAGLNLLEVRLSQQAGQRSTNAAVKQFAQQMVVNHGSMGQQWTSLAAKNGLPASVALNSIQQQVADELNRRSAAEFDQAYMDAVVAGHEQDASTLQRIGSGAQSAEVRQLATSGVAATQQHLSRARALANQVGAAVATNSPAPGAAGDGRRTGAGQGNPADGRYAQELAYGHMMEVRLAQMAQRRAKNPQVRQFANQVARDFGRWQQCWTDLAANHGGVKVNSNLGPMHKQKLDRLQNASNGNFDQVYVDIVVENLGSIVPYLQKEGRAARSADVRNAADEELPSVREKLNAAQRLDRQVQANGNGNGKGKDKDKDKDNERSLSNKE